MDIRNILFVGLILGAIGGLVGCHSPAKEEPREAVKSDKLVARVASIYRKEGYALIQRYGGLRIKEDMVLYTLSVNGKTASLKPTGERLGQYLAVDIVSGDLNIGDAVYLRDLSEKREPENKGVQNKSKS